MTRTGGNAGTLAGIAVAAALALCAAAHALQAPPLAPRAAPPTVFTGREFAGVDLPASVQKADVTMQARRVWSWNEGGAPGAGSAGTRRALLDGDVRIKIGIYDFAATKASVWIEPVESEGRPIEQIAVYLENVRDAGADAIVSQASDRLLVTALVEGQVRLRTDLLNQGRPDDEFLVESEVRLARYLAQTQAVPQQGPQPAGPQVVERGEAKAEEMQVIPPDWGSNLPQVNQNPPIFARDGVVSFYGPDRTLVTGESENSLVITGGVVMQYVDIKNNRTLQISAESLVAFVDPGSVAEALRFGPEQVRGVYLEGDVVATDGKYTLRGQRFYYDVRNNRGVVLDAVFWTYDAKRGIPLYVRADVIRQESANQWTAGKARLASAEFFEPEFAIGATSVTLTRVERPDGSITNQIEAKDVTPTVAGVPFFRLSSVKGEVDNTSTEPLRGLDMGTESGGLAIRTRWDLFALLGLERSEGLSADLLVDGYFARGPALGADVKWSIPDATGSFFTYYIYDNGTETLTSGDKIDLHDENRVLLEGDHRWRLNQNWTLFLETAYISDPTMLNAFFPLQAQTRREFTNSVFARYLQEGSAFTAEVRGTLTDFAPNEYLTQSLGYQVQRLPEVAYYRMNDRLFGGWLNHSSESRFSALQLQFTEPTASEMGYNTTAKSQRAFGLNPDQSLADRLTAEGVPQNTVLRFDTRHEFTAPLAAGPVNITPFGVARVTAYDDDFSAFRGPGGDTDRTRLWGSAGLRASTTFTRVDNSVESKLFDLNRIRNTIEPSFLVWTSGTTIPINQLPDYDESIESISAGTAIRAGLNSTWQTKRGGPDGERSVDWITLSGNYVQGAGNTQQKSPIGRFFESRPEMSIFGQYFVTDGIIRLTDAVALTTTNVYDFHINRMSQVAAGVLLDHGYGFSSYAEVRQLQAVDSTFLNLGANYELTRKLAMNGYIVYDLVSTQFQQTGAIITRRFSQWTSAFEVNYDDIRGDVTVGFKLTPAGLSDSNRLRVFTQETDVLGRTEPAPLPSWNHTRPGGS